MTVRKGKINALLIITIMILLVSIIYVVSSVPKFQQGKSFMKKMDAKRQQLYNDLGLTNEQRKLLEENKSKHREQAKALFNQIHENTVLIGQELQKDELNMGKIYQINNELKKLQAQMLDDRLEGMLEVRKILKPEQFKKFEAKMDGRMGHFKNK